MSAATRQIRAILTAELRLMRRNSAILATSIGVPVAVAAYFVWSGRDDLGALGWSFPVAILFLLMFGMSVYMTTTLALTARREDLYLKRLRTSEAADGTILAGLLSPALLIGFAQCLVVVLIVAVFGPATPANPLLLLLAVLLGLAMSAALGMATTGLVGSTQQADMATMPFFILLIGTGIWGGFGGADGPGTAQLLLPGGAVLDVVRLAYDRELAFLAQLTEALPALGVLAGWTMLGILAVHRFFRWEPRH
jgi:ABC-2 type transport system permease protein